MTTIKVAGGALNQTPMDWQGNFQNIVNAINEARAQQVKILCLPELCLTGYGCEDLFLSDWLHKKAFQQILKIKEHTKGITVAVGLPLIFDKKLYNCACVLSDEKILGFTAKSILANDGIHYESRWFSAWEQGKIESLEIAGQSYPIGTTVYETQGVRFGIEICEDAWHEKRPLEVLSKQNIQLVLNLSASHFSFEKSAKRYDLSVPVSKQYNCAYIYCNLLGNEAGRVVYDGEIIIAHRGELVAHNRRFSFKSVNLLTAELNLNSSEHRISKTLETKEDFLSENKNQVFASTIALGLFDYMRKSRSKGFVLSLSGGADSSACAVLVAYMIRKGLEDLGLDLFLSKIALSSLSEELKNLSKKEQAKNLSKHLLTTAYQATKNSGEETLSAAKSLAESLGAVFYAWSVDSQVEDYISTLENAIGEKITWEEQDIARQNIQARTRSPIIWMLTNIRNALLLTTSNRSEGSVGYATMDGDTSGSIAPIAGIDKAFLIDWLKWAEDTLDFSGLSEVNQLKPTAELRPPSSKQTDEDDLMPYPILQAIEELAIGDHRSPVEVFLCLKEKKLCSEEQLKNYLSKFYRLWSRNQWKRERLAPSFHLDDYNVDPKTWCRFPILSGSFREELEDLEKQ